MKKKKKKKKKKHGTRITPLPNLNFGEFLNEHDVGNKFN